MTNSTNDTYVSTSSSWASAFDGPIPLYIALVVINGMFVVLLVLLIVICCKSSDRCRCSPRWRYFFRGTFSSDEHPGMNYVRSGLPPKKPERQAATFIRESNCGSGVRKSLSLISGIRYIDSCSTLNSTFDGYISENIDHLDEIFEYHS